MSRLRRMTPAEWAPGRSHLGITKLVGFLMLRSASPEEPRRAAVLTIRPGQNTAEANAVGLVYLGLMVAGLYHVASRHTAMTPLKAILHFVPFVAIALVLMQVTVGVLTLVLNGARRIGMFRGRPNHEVQSTVFHLVYIALAIVATGQEGPIRVIGLAWLAIVAFDLLLRIVGIALRKQYAAVDDRFRSDV